MSDQEEFETRIKEAKAKRERLVNDRAQKMAVLNAAKEKLKKLSEKAEAKGFALADLPDLIAEKKQVLDEKITVFETDLEEVEESLTKYDN